MMPTDTRFLTDDEWAEIATFDNGAWTCECKGGRCDCTERVGLRSTIDRILAERRPTVPEFSSFTRGVLAALGDERSHLVIEAAVERGANCIRMNHDDLERQYDLLQKAHIAYITRPRGDQQ